MATLDITRRLQQPHKHYSAVRLQQGRLLLDADHNEGAYLEAEDRRRAIEDLFGSKGSPDDGFGLGRPLPLTPPLPEQTAQLRPGDALTTENLQLNGVLTPVLPVSLRSGTFYLGGLRFDLENAEHFGLQRDFLQLKPADVPQADVGDADSFHVLYYLHGWEQAVSALEDEELLEQALGGVETSGRLRRMRRIEALGRLTPTDTCDSAFARVIQQLEADNARFDINSSELVSLGRLQLELVTDEDAQNCRECAPDPATSFLGADNQTLRVQLTSATTFVWALDNAAPLFRVKVTGLDDPDAEVRVELLDGPLDESQWPLADRVVELMPFSAVLDGKMPAGHEHPHFKKVAERLGAFTRVAEPFDPETRSFTLDKQLGIDEMRAFVHEWDPRHPAAAELDFIPVGDERFLYLRLWHSAPTLAEVHLPTTNSPVLGSTQVRPLFRRAGRRGDFWIAALRPGTPERIVPVDLLARPDGVAPHGPRDFYAPLAMLEVTNGVVTVSADCRPRIEPLTDGGCVTFTVGDGATSQGDFNSIQQAITALPSEGGRILVQRGTYRERLTLNNLTDVSIEGCGDSSIIETPGGGSDATGPTAALITVTGSTRVRIASLRLQAIHERAVAVRESEESVLEGLSAVAGLRLGSEFRPGANLVSAPLFEVKNSSEIALRQLLAEPHARGAFDIVDCDHVSAEELVCAGSQEGPTPPEQPMIRLRDSELSRLQGGVLSSFGQVGVSVEGTATHTIELSDLAVICGSHSSARITVSQPAIDIDGAERVVVRGCTVTLDESFSENAAIVVRGAAIRVIGNQLEVLSECFDSPPRPASECEHFRVQAWGGIQLRGGCAGVELSDNHVNGGVGHGITLGSVIYTDSTETVRSRQGAGSGQMQLRSDGHYGATGRIRSSFRDAARRLLTAHDEGPLAGIVIRNNRIEQMSGNGISVLSLLGLPDGNFIDVGGLVIEENTITHNLQFPSESVALETGVLPFDASLAAGGLQVATLPAGGIVLGTVMGADLRDNVVAENGTSNVVPTSGIFILNGDAIRITNNRITANGGRASAVAAAHPQPGVRAGIAVLLAGTGDAASRSALASLLAGHGSALADDGASLRVSNNSVRHPEGRALFAVATGPVAIQGNFLSSEGNHGADTLTDAFSVGDVVYVQNIGVPWETEIDSPISPGVYSSFTTPTRTSSYLNFVTPLSPWQFAGEGGSIQFNDNQVTLDWEVLRVPLSGFAAPIAYFPVALLTLDHLSIESNQFAFRLRGQKIRTSPPDTLSPIGGMGVLSVPSILSQVFGIGGTVLVGGNRAAEVVGTSMLSILTISQLMSSASFNQTTHEILTTNKSFAEPTPSPPEFKPSEDIDQPYLTRRGNQVMFSAKAWTFARANTVRLFANRFVSLLFESA